LVVITHLHFEKFTLRTGSKRRLLAGLLTGIFGALAVPSVSAAFGEEAGNMRLSAETVAARGPVWTEELGDVPLDKYTLKELAAMVREFWTPERMRNAIPADNTIPMDVFLRENLASDRFIFPEVPLTTLAEPMLPTVPHNQFFLKSGATPNFSIANGKVFYLDQSDGEIHECSGAALSGVSMRLVATAGHCVHGGPGKTWHQNWYFVPAYTNGMHPVGSFNAYVTRTSIDWIIYGKTGKGLRADVAFVTTYSEDESWRVVEAVGGHGIAFGGSFAFDADIFGYPKNMANGKYMKTCSGPTYGHILAGYPFLSISGCNFGEGASGGPWLHQYDNATGIGTMRGITSFSLGNSSGYASNHAAYFNLLIKDMHTAANYDWWEGLP